MASQKVKKKSLSDSALGGLDTKKKGLLAIVALAIVAAAVKFVFFKDDFLYSGTLEATKVDLSASIPSEIKEVKVIEGEHVAAGQELVELTCDDIRVEARFANQNFERNARLFKVGSASEEVMDQMRTRKENADVRVARCSIRSPIEGVVLSRFHEPGEWVNPGSLLLSLANIKDIWAFIYVPQTRVASLKIGMKVAGQLPELPGQNFEGKIIKINDEAEFTPKNVQTRSERVRLIYGVKVSFLGSNAKEVLKPGMTIEVKLPPE